MRKYNIFVASGSSFFNTDENFCQTIIHDCRIASKKNNQNDNENVNGLFIFLHIDWTAHI